MKIVFREMPDMQNTGERKLYPTVFHAPTIPHDTFVDLMAKQTQMSRTAIEGVFIELGNVLNQYLANGHAVKINHLGTFDVALGMAEGVKAEKLGGARCNTRDVQVKGIKFLPDVEWLRSLRGQVHFDRVDTIPIKKVTTTVEERLQKALAYLAENAFLTVQEYARCTGLSHTRANQELNAFCEDPESGIRSRGQHSHKVYVKS